MAKKIMAPIDPAISKRLTRFREVHISKVQMTAAAALELQPSTLWRYEEARTRIPASFIKTLQEKYLLNPDWLLTGVGKEKIGEKTKNLTTDIAALREVIDDLTTQVKVMNINQLKLWDIVERQQKEIEELRKLQK